MSAEQIFSQPQIIYFRDTTDREEKQRYKQNKRQANKQEVDVQVHMSADPVDELGGGVTFTVDDFSNIPIVYVNDYESMPNITETIGVVQPDPNVQPPVVQSPNTPSTSTHFTQITEVVEQDLSSELQPDTKQESTFEDSNARSPMEQNSNAHSTPIQYPVVVQTTEVIEQDFSSELQPDVKQELNFEDSQASIGTFTCTEWQSSQFECCEYPNAKDQDGSFDVDAFVDELVDQPIQSESDAAVKSLLTTATPHKSSRTPRRQNIFNDDLLEYDDMELNSAISGIPNQNDQDYNPLNMGFCKPEYTYYTPQKDPSFIQHVMHRVMNTFDKDTANGDDTGDEINTTDSPIPPTPTPPGATQNKRFKSRRQSIQSSQQSSQQAPPQTPQSQQIVGHVELELHPSTKAWLLKEERQRLRSQHSDRSPSPATPSIMSTSYAPPTSPISPASTPSPTHEEKEEYLFNFYTTPSTPHIDTAEITDTPAPENPKTEKKKKMFPTPATMYSSKERVDAGAARLRTYTRATKIEKDKLIRETPLIELSFGGDDDDDDEDDSIDNMTLAKRLAELKTKRKSTKKKDTKKNVPMLPTMVHHCMDPRKGRLNFTICTRIVLNLNTGPTTRR